MVDLDFSDFMDLDMPAQRFEEPVDINSVQQRIQGCVPDNTRKKMSWAVRLFHDWQHFRIVKQTTTASTSSDVLVYKPLEEMEKNELNFMLPLFLFDAKKKNGDPYPSKSLYDLFAMLNYYVQKELHRPWSLFKDVEFIQARRALEARMKEIAKAGHVSGNRKAQLISTEYEAQMWSAGTLGSDSPTVLLNTVIYLLGLHFALRGGEELRRLRYGALAQVRKQVDADGRPCLLYVEDYSKTNQGGIKNIGQPPKKVGSLNVGSDFY